MVSHGRWVAHELVRPVRAAQYRDACAYPLGTDVRVVGDAAMTEG